MFVKCVLMVSLVCGCCVPVFSVFTCVLVCVVCVFSVCVCLVCVCLCCFCVRVCVCA